MSPSILGLNAPDEACPICDLKPQHFLETPIEDFVECHRCGFLSRILPGERGEKTPVPGTHAGWINVFRRYYRETGGKLSSAELAELDGIHRARCDALEEWCRANPQIIERVKLAEAAPFVTAIAIVVEPVPGTRAWNLILPSGGAGEAVVFPIDPRTFAVGTVISISSPITAKLEEAEPPSLLVVN